MRLLAVSVGQAEIIRHMGKDVPTAIFKSPVSGPVMVRTTGADGDQQANLLAHGGPDKTVHAFPIENYRFYQSRFGNADYPHGYFGENLTTQGLCETDLRIGDQVRVGQALLEVTMPRMPCFKFGVRLGNSKALEACISSGRTGYYLRVLQEGPVAAGDD
jgi:MOSC domain-containing protein YiiM